MLSDVQDFTHLPRALARGNMRNPPPYSLYPDRGTEDVHLQRSVKAQL
jgi:hypothetical protein